VVGAGDLLCGLDPSVAARQSSRIVWARYQIPSRRCRRTGGRINSGFQDYFDALMSGNLERRRMVKFMPAKFKLMETRQPPLKDQYDE
jgi:hypothetical protein